ncbi:hypothetical protein H3S85_07030 [Bartonella sp. M0187]|uniref:hypothetical protein n=1 Tax=Bartonella apihabitans TaxID=2750929 RepID=UPI0018DB25FC|nr:hypothetical protein [Bartonella apihabitans]MBI0026219.1 hypothetical protein [Bartonella apihabitans]
MFIKPLGVFISRLNDNSTESNKPERGDDQKKGILEKRSPYLGDFYQPPRVRRIATGISSGA